MRKKTLIVDDDVGSLNLLKLIASTIGVDVDLASSGEDALLKLQAFGYGRLITDLVMPGMDGFTLARLARNRSPELEVVMMTGSIMPDLHERAAKAGIHKVVFKPLNLDQFITLL